MAYEKPVGKRKQKSGVESGGGGGFLCQAEYGIRDRVRARGLGDGYKRQAVAPLPQPPIETIEAATRALPSRIAGLISPAVRAASSARIAARLEDISLSLLHI